MNIIFDGKEIDIFNDGELQAAIDERTDRIVSSAPAESAGERERALFSALSYLAVKCGALASFHAYRRDVPVDIDHLIDLTENLYGAVGMKFIAPQPYEAPQIIVPPTAANEGADL